MDANNKVFELGRATEGYVLKQFPNKTSYIDFTLAVDNKKYTKENGRPKAFFFNVRVFGKTAEYLEKYGETKGRLLVVGSLESDSYTKEGTNQKIYYTRINAEEVHIIDYKKKETVKGTEDTFGGYATFAPGEDAELPFN